LRMSKPLSCPAAAPLCLVCNTFSETARNRTGVPRKGRNWHNLATIYT
jgi:hypothetical protein